MKLRVPERIEGDGVYLLRVQPEVAGAILAGELPEGLGFAQDYPGEPSLEVMDIFIGERQPDAKGFTPYFVVRGADDTVVGDIGFSFTDGQLDSPTVGYDVVESLWGQGYATRALQALLGFLLSAPGIRSVRADTLKSHTASRRVMEKAGMRFVREGIEEVDRAQEEVVFYKIEGP